MPLKKLLVKQSLRGIRHLTFFRCFVKTKKKSHQLLPKILPKTDKSFIYTSTFLPGDSNMSDWLLPKCIAYSACPYLLPEECKVGRGVEGW